MCFAPGNLDDVPTDHIGDNETHGEEEEEAGEVDGGLDEEVESHKNQKTIQKPLKVGWSACWEEGIASSLALVGFQTRLFPEHDRVACKDRRMRPINPCLTHLPYRGVVGVTTLNIEGTTQVLSTIITRLPSSGAQGGISVQAHEGSGGA